MFERLTGWGIRTATPADGEACATIYAPIVQHTTISFETTPPSPDEMSARIARCLEHFPWLIAEASGKVLGYAYAGPHRARVAYQWSCEVSVYIADGAKRSGLARTLYTHLFRILAAQGYAESFAGVTLPNDPSVKFHEAFGFTPVGVYKRVGFKHGTWRDVGWWARNIQSLGDAPAPPISYSQLTPSI